MSKEQRLIDANGLTTQLEERQAFLVKEWGYRDHYTRGFEEAVDIVQDTPTVEAVEVKDPKLLKAIMMLMKQYEHSKNSEYVHDPIAHAFYHTWKQLDSRR